ncbi:MAG: 4Fe-4S binding protein [Deltaproteobacteria bacterium]|nr:4Fe-4S binding protein [Deltaproteobacteria bacterium]
MPQPGQCLRRTDAEAGNPSIRRKPSGFSKKRSQGAAQISPRISDGIIGACVPEITQNSCSQCEACVEACREQAISLETELPVIQIDRCLYCGQCIQVCPTGTLGAGTRGYRVLLGGKLGRHPRLARELSGVFSEDSVLSIVKDCISFYRRHSKGGERFAEIFTDKVFEETAATCRLIEGVGDGCKKA